VSDGAAIGLGVVALVASGGVGFGAGAGRFVPPWPVAVRRRVLVAGRPLTRLGAAVLVGVAVIAVVGGTPPAAVALAAPGLVMAALLEAAPLALGRGRVRDALVVLSAVGAGAVLCIAGACAGDEAAAAVLAGLAALAALARLRPERPVRFVGAVALAPLLVAALAALTSARL
jgi:hypothetical protein